MPTSDWFRKKKPAIPTSNSGHSIAEAIVIHASNSMQGVAAEYEYVASQCGTRNVDWQLDTQALLEHGGRHYDLLNIRLRDDECREYYFDITEFFGKF